MCVVEVYYSIKLSSALCCSVFLVLTTRSTRVHTLVSETRLAVGGAYTLTPGRAFLIPTSESSRFSTLLTRPAAVL